MSTGLLYTSLIFYTHWGTDWKFFCQLQVKELSLFCYNLNFSSLFNFLVPRWLHWGKISHHCSKVFITLCIEKKCIFSHLPAQSSISVPSLRFVIWRRHCIFSVCSAKHLLVFSCDPGTFFSGLLFGYYRCFAYEFPQSEPSSPPCVKKHILCSFCGSVTFQSGATLKGVLSFMLPGYLLCNT